MSDKDKQLLKIPNEVLKIKVPQSLPLQIVLTTHYITDALYLLKRIKALHRGTEEHKAAIRIYRRLLTEHQKQLRERLKAVSTFLILKAVLKDNPSFELQQHNELAKHCDYKCVKTLRSNLNVLQSLQLIEYRNQTAFIAGWEKLIEVFKIEAKHVRHHFVKQGAMNIETILKRIAMQKKESQCLQAANYRLHKVTELQQMVSSISGRSDLEAVNDLQCRVYTNPTLSTVFDLDDWLLFEVCRGDTALSYRTWSCLFGFKSIGGFKHLKQKMIKGGLIAVFRRVITLPDGVKKTSKKRSCCLGTTIYNRGLNQLILVKPDQIVYLTLNH